MSGGSLGGLISEDIIQYDKTAFGELAIQQPTPQSIVHFPYNINSDIVNTSVVGSGTVTHSGQFAVMASGASTSSSGRLQSNDVLEYHPGIGGLVRFTCIYGVGTYGNTQLTGVGNATDGLFFGYNENSFGILHRSASSEMWIAQSSWNVDVMDGTGPSGMILNTEKGNVFQIRYQWLGFGALNFYIENENTGLFQRVHMIEYANKNTVTSLENPSFPFFSISENTTNNTDIQMKISSFGLFVEGKINSSGHTRNAVDNEKSITSSTETNIITIRNKTTYQSIVNQVRVQPDFISIATDGSKTVDVRVYKNASIGGVPSFSDISTNTSVIDFDTEGTTISNGTLLASIPVDKVGNSVINTSEFEIILSPGDTLTVSAESSGNNDVLVGLSWQERFN